jgi:hypothetical protein
MTRRISHLVTSITSEDEGFSLPLIASMLVLLLGLAAFAIDLGWIYLNGGRLQRGADSAALAGVVYLPHDLPSVQTLAVSGANANGSEVGTVVPDGGAPENVGPGTDTLAWRQLEDNKLQVELTTSVDTFFLKVLGFDEIGLKRASTAQFIKPVPLGSPANCIGIGEGVDTNGLTGHATGVGGAYDVCNDYTQNFWSAINGRRTAVEHGDPYGPTCGWQCSGGNPNHDPYYYFAVDVAEGAGNWVDVFLYDGGFYDRDNFADTGDEDDLSNSDGGGTHMSFELFDPDTSPQIPENNNTRVNCFQGSDTVTIDSEDNTPPYRDRWRRMCRILNPEQGIYVLKVGNGGSDIGGSNSYSLLADSQSFSTSALTRIYSLNEMSIFTNDDDGNATVYIAEVAPVHANKTLELRFYDPGETAGNGTMTVLPPPGVSGISCSWTATDNHPPIAPTSGSSCSINTSSGGDSRYNAEWITMQIQIPADYTCDADCFWKMNLALNTAHDRTTWEARVIGNPVALVPNP